MQYAIYVRFTNLLGLPMIFTSCHVFHIKCSISVVVFVFMSYLLDNFRSVKKKFLLTNISLPVIMIKIRPGFHLLVSWEIKEKSIDLLTSL